MPRFLRRAAAALLAAASLAAAAGCAVQSDRTAELLALGLADREAAVARLEAEERTAEPAAWRAYSLGVLHAGAADYAAMDRWFALCAERGGDLYAARMAAVRREHWRRHAEEADAAFAAGRWADAVLACDRALSAESGHPDTETRRTEARLLAEGPTPERLAALAAAGRTAAVDRWLEAAAAGAVPAAARERAAEALAAGPVAPLGAFVLGELARLRGDAGAMARWYDAAGGLADENRRAAIAEGRRAAAARLLAAALAAWTAGDQAGCLARLDTAAAALPGAGHLAAARRRAETLGAAIDTAAVARVLADPTLEDAWLEAWLARLRRTGRTDAAVRVADHLLAPGRETDPAVAARARRARAACLADRQAWDAAAFDLRLLLEAAPDPALAAALGDVLAAGSRWEDALAAYDRAVALGGESADLHLKRARAAFGAGRWAETNDHAAAAARLAPGDAAARALAAQAAALAPAAREEQP